jgi:hypothetical protein
MSKSVRGSHSSALTELERRERCAGYKPGAPLELIGCDVRAVGSGILVPPHGFGNGWNIPELNCTEEPLEFNHLRGNWKVQHAGSLAAVAPQRREKPPYSLA